MQITCPSCAAQYKVNDAQVPPQGVAIKCPKCTHRFTVKPDGNASAAGSSGVPLPGTGVPGPGGVPLPGSGVAGSSGVPLPGSGVPGSGGVPAPGSGVAGSGGVPLPGSGVAGSSGVPLPGSGVAGSSGVPLPGKDAPMGNASSGLNDLFGSPSRAAPASPIAQTGQAPSLEDIFGDASSPPSTASSGASAAGGSLDDIFGTPQQKEVSTDSDLGLAFHSQEGLDTNEEIGQRLSGGVLDFIDDTAKPEGASQQLYRVRKRSGRVLGPYDEATIHGMFDRQELMGHEEASIDGVAWKPLAQIPAFTDTIQKTMQSVLAGIDGDASQMDPDGVDLPMPIGDHQTISGEHLSTGQLLEAERSKEKAALKVKERKEHGSQSSFVGILVLILLVGTIGGGVALGVFTKHGYFGYLLIKEMVSPTPKVVEDKKNEEVLPPPFRAPNTGITVDKALALDAYPSYRQGVIGQARILDAGKALPALPQQAKEAASHHARFLSYLIVVENMPSFAKGLEDVLKSSDPAFFPQSIAEVGRYYHMRKWDIGISRLKKLADPSRGLKPKELAEVYLWLGLGYRGKNDSMAAMNSFDQALQAMPNYLTANYHQAEALFVLNENEAAHSYLDKVLAVSPVHPRANLLRGLKWSIHTKTRKKGQALLTELADSKRKTQAAPPQRAAALIGLAELALGDRQWSLALEHMNAAVDLLPSSTDIRVKQGNIALQMREFAIASESFSKLLESHPGDVNAIIGLVKAKLGTEDSLAAYSILLDVVQKKPNNARLIFWVGMAEKALLKHDKARESFKKAVKLNSSLPGPHVQLALDMANRGLLKEALAHVAKAQNKVGPGERNRVRVVKATIFMRQRNYSMAKRELTQAIEENPRNTRARALFVDLLLKDRELDKAKLQVKEALALDPRNPKVLAAEAEIYAVRGNHEKSLEKLEGAMSLNSTDANLYLRAARVAILAESYARAKGYLDTVDELQPSNPEVLNLRGQVMRVTDPKQATRRFLRAIELSPEDPRIQYQLGLTYIRMGANLDAIDLLQKAIQLDPGYADAFFQLGNAQRGLGRNGAAEQSYRECARLAPERADAWVQVADIQSIIGDSKQAIKSFRKAMEADPLAPTPVCRMGLTLVERLGELAANLREGRKMLEKCVKLMPNHERAYRKLGDAYKDINRFPDAVRNYRKHLQVNPSAMDRVEVCGILKDLNAPCP